MQDCIGKVAKKVLKDLPSGGIALLENVRFHPGEEKNDPKFKSNQRFNIFSGNYVRAYKSWNN